MQALKILACIVQVVKSKYYKIDLTMHMEPQKCMCELYNIYIIDHISS